MCLSTFMCFHKPAAIVERIYMSEYLTIVERIYMSEYLTIVERIYMSEYLTIVERIYILNKKRSATIIFH